MESQASAPKNIRALVNFLRSSNGPKTKVGVLNGKRHDYFKGTGAVKSLLSPAYKKASNAKNSTLPKVETEQQAAEVLHNVIPFTFYLRVDRADVNSKEGRPLQINQMQMFKPELYYAWFYEGSQLMLQLSGFGMILLMLAGVMFPLWPAKMRVGVWYLSIAMLGLIGAFFGLAIIRLILWGITSVTMRPGIWIFPNLFEDVGFVDSFIPLWAWDVPPPAKKNKKVKQDGNNGSAAASGAGAAGRAAVANLPGQNDVRPKAPQLPRAAAETKPTTPTKKAPASSEQRLPEQANVSSNEGSRQSDNLAGLD